MTSQASKPLVSVIIPVYNSEPYIAQAIISVLRQTYNNIEIVIVDDGSTDRTGEVIRNFDDARIKYLYQNNHGVSHARNRGLEISRGEFIAFLDSDDRWVPKKLHRVNELINQHPHIRDDP